MVVSYGKLLGTYTIPGDSSVTFSSPNVGGHQQSLKRVTNHHPKKGHQQNRQVFKGPTKKLPKIHSSPKSRSKRSWFGGTCWGSAYRQGAPWAWPHDWPTDRPKRNPPPILVAQIGMENMGPLWNFWGKSRCGEILYWVVVSNIFGIFTPKIGEMIQFD